MTQKGRYGLSWNGPLKDDLIVYCAWDVEPLHELHRQLTSSLSPDYHHLVSQLSELEIIRAIDPGLVKRKKSNLKAMEAVTLHLSSLPPDNNHASLYTCMEGHVAGYKHVYYSSDDRRANIVLDSRQEAVTAWQQFSSWATQEMREAGTECALVMEHHDNEVFGDQEQDTADETVSDSAGPTSAQAQTNVIDAAKCKEVTEALMASKCPVVMDFSYRAGEDSIGLVMYVGQPHSYKMDVTMEMVKEGKLGDLMKSDCVKVVNRLDSDSSYAALKYFSDNGVTVNKVYDMNYAVKAVDYLEYGQSWFQQQGLSNKDLVKFLGLKLDMKSSQQHRLYMAYLQLQQMLPDYIQEKVFELGKYEVAMAAKNDLSLKAKYKKLDLKRHLDQSTVHIRMVGHKVSKEDRDAIINLVSLFSDAEDMHAQIYHHERCLLVSVKYRHKMDDMIKFLEDSVDSVGARYIVSSPRELRKVIEKTDRKVVEMLALVDIQAGNAKSLFENGLLSQE